MDVMLGFSKEETLRRVCGKVANLTALTRLVSAGGDQGINKAAEDFYCGLLNIILDTQKYYPGIKLVNMNAIQSNFPAIDLGDREKGVAVQVTTTEHREKINHTLEKFFEKKLQKDFHKLIILIIGKKDETKKSFKVEAGFSFSPSQDIWDIDRLGAVLGDLSEEKLGEVERYFDVKVRYLRSSSPAINLPMISAMTAGGFVGREQELAQIAAEMANGTKPIFISGLGGMGKTELAVRFGKTYTGGNVYMVSFLESFRRTLTQNVAAGIPTLQGQKLSEQEIYDRVMHQLKQLDQADILIIDNADGDGSNFSKLEDEAYQELKKLPMHLIITTRCSSPGAVKADAMKEEQLRKLFELHAVNIPIEERDALIHAVNSHTMTVDLMARTMAEGYLTTEQMLRAVETGVMDEDFENIGTYHNQDPAQRRIDAHLLALFRVADVDEDAKKVLSCAVLLPQSGMDIDVFRKALPEGLTKALKAQEKRGWLKFDHGTRTLTIHPVIRLVCRKEIEPDDESCRDFLETAWKQFDIETFDADFFRQYAELFSQAAEILPDRYGEWAEQAGWFWARVGVAIDLTEDRSAEECETALYGKDLTKAYDKALEYKQRALSIRKKLLPADHPELAESYSSVGDAYKNLGNYLEELEFHKKALEILKIGLPEQHPQMAKAYKNVGDAYGNMGDHWNALDYKMQAMAIQEQLQPQSYPDLARIYDDVAGSYIHLGLVKEGLPYSKKAVEMWEKVVPVRDIFLALCYGNLSDTCVECGENELALEYALKALKIYDNSVHEEYELWAGACFSVAMIYEELGDHNSELEYMRRALAIAEKYLPQENPAISDYRYFVRSTVMFKWMRALKIILKISVAVLYGGWLWMTYKMR